ncbi:hypothetical protein SODALDRAFT_351219 [Sodiomyces alkalinus F11]|uniref:SnoaL-like domain-containing protein n=1 Tax=Sodiomyces alkalinus (strain CBS 110278 / VKM F-3762 / F11) TaxID=1314773 RepID=A0A3N2PU69_SODAK|nr:hypothetical protein SODALDRAFT_351219 [Sodiomyces alkalinus F11]ROT38063.1 hypothetical protein SODALDRAFT_351219 [Sodiomyces alkalinus F11]
MTTPKEAHSRQYSHINGTPEDLLHRLAISELCKGWPVYRDASEWMNFRSLFAQDATVWTTWSGARSVDDFIAISKAGKASGAFIQHRECGTLVELNREMNRAVGKMKATITQRFVSPEGIEYDVDCDCRFLFFCTYVNESPMMMMEGDSASGTGAGVEDVSGGEWKAQYVKLIYEKDRLVPVDGVNVPKFELEELEKYPVGYRYLSVAQASLGHEIDTKLATVKDIGTFERMYACMEKWLDGEDPELFW